MVTLAIQWLIDHYRQPLRWWQRLVITRLLEHDADGLLVWQDATVSTARQVGKSVLLSSMGAWRLMASELFGETQLVMHTGKDLNVCRQVQRPARQWARAIGLRVVETNGKEEIAAHDGAQWLVRAQTSVYGSTATLGLVDEAWAVLDERVADGLEPTIVERASGQIVLFSTANKRATALVLLRRAAAFASWAAPMSSLLVEWSAPRDADIHDRAAWRMASPHWGPSRERLLTSKLARLNQGVSEDPSEDDGAEAFRTQYLNIWPRRVLLPRGKAEPLCDRQTWEQRRDDYANPGPDTPVTVAVEDWYGMGAAGAACALLPDGRLLTWGGLFANRSEAYAWAAFTLGRRPSSRLVIGATLSVAEAESLIPDAESVSLCTTATTRAALPRVRSLILSGRLAHSGDPDMAAQVSTVRLIASPSGGLVFAHGDSVRPDLLKALAWAVSDRSEPAAETPDWFVF
jgi:hypothetical protein